MSLKEQVKTLKNNWLLILVALIVLIVFYSGAPSSIYSAGTESYSSHFGGDAAPKAMGMRASYDIEPSPMPISPGDFSPEVKERRISKSSSMTNEVETNAFDDAATEIKKIVSSTNSFLLDENVNANDVGRKKYKTGYYTIKVEAGKYDDVISRFKNIGEVKSFHESAEDITGAYTNNKIELETEKARSERYQQLYKEAQKVEDKLNINDRIFEQERKIKYLEDSIVNMDKRVRYSSITLTLNEKRSEYADITFVKFSELVTTLVSSTSSLLDLIFAILPYMILILIIRAVIKFVKRRK